MLRSFRSRRLLDSGAHALYNTVFCPVMLPFVVHSRVATPVPYNSLTQLATCKSLSTTAFDRYSTVKIAQRHKQVCSASASTASNTHALETAEDNVVQPHISHGLSPEQAAAVFAGDGHLRIVAGPGSGKTRVLTARVEHLIRQQGCKPWQLVVITFSNKAARELQERLETLLGPKTANQVISGTFHSVGCQIVRRHVQHLGDTGREVFAIFDQDDTKNVMKLALKKHLKLQKGADEADLAAEADDMPDSQLPEWEQPKQLDRLAKRFRHEISLIKNGVATCFGLDGTAAVAKYNASTAALVNRLDTDNELAMKANIDTAQAYDMYEAELKQNRGLDFDDLLSWPVALLQNRPDVRQKLQKRYKHILVDEFQDTNAPQYEMVRLLAGDQANVFVVGDPDQAIYGWRGANVVNMSQSFDVDYPGSHTLQLKDNYRSTPQVLRGAEGVLKNILGGPAARTPLVPLNAAGPQIEVTQVTDERAEADFVVTRIQQLHRSGMHKWRDMAVLYRTNAQSRLFEEQLVRRNIPYQIIGGTPFWLRKEVKDVMAYVKLAVNPEDDVSLARVINQPTRGIGQESLLKLRDWAEKQGLGLGQALFTDYQAHTSKYEDAMPESNSNGALQGWPECTALPVPFTISLKELGLSKKAIAGVEDFCRIIMMTRALLTHYPIAPVLNGLLEHIKFEEFVQSGRTARGQQNVNRWQNVQQVMGAAEHAASQPEVRGLDYLDTDQPHQEPRQGLAKVQNFLEQVALWSEPEKYAVDSDEDGAPDVVNVLTLHLSKGLEYNAVFIVGCEDSLMPHGGLRDDLSDPRDLERHNEEVRLLYVGMTRAKQQLHLTHAQHRSLRGGTQRFHAKISPFLQSIPGVDLSKQATQMGWQNTRRYMQTQSDPAGSTYDGAHKPSLHSSNPAPTSTPPRTPAQLRASRRQR